MRSRSGHRALLLVEDNPRDVELTMRALRKTDFADTLVLAEDGVEALKYLFGEDGDGGGCPPEQLPAAVLLGMHSLVNKILAFIVQTLLIRF